MHYTELQEIHNNNICKSVIRSIIYVLLSLLIYNVGKGLQQI